MESEIKLLGAEQKFATMKKGVSAYLGWLGLSELSFKQTYTL